MRVALWGYNFLCHTDVLRQFIILSGQHERLFMISKYILVHLINYMQIWQRGLFFNPISILRKRKCVGKNYICVPCVHEIKRYTRQSLTVYVPNSFCRVRASPSGEGSTMFTAHSRATNQSLTTWRVWRLRRRSTRSNGFLSRTQPTSCFPPTVSHSA